MSTLPGQYGPDELVNSVAGLAYLGGLEQQYYIDDLCINSTLDDPQFSITYFAGLMNRNDRNFTLHMQECQFMLGMTAATLNASS